DRAVVRVADLADLLVTSLGLAAADGPVAALRTVPGGGRCEDPGRILAGHHPGGRTVGAVVPAGFDLDDLAVGGVVVAGRRRCDRRARALLLDHLGGPGGVPGQRPASRSISRASATSCAVSPPAECVDRTKVTLRQRISISGW